MRTARFWVLIGCRWVRLSLRDGEALEYGWGERHEEGYHREYFKWYREGDTVYELCDTEGRDCDGRVDSSSLVRCHVLRLRGREVALWSDEVDELAERLQLRQGKPVPPRAVRLPDWRRVEERQRDYTAEAAGY